MASTTVKLPDELKRRAVAAAKAQGMTTHAFLVEAVRQTTDAAERRARFVSDAVEARQDATTNDSAYDAQDVHAFVRDKIAGDSVARPSARKWRE